MFNKIHKTLYSDSALLEHLKCYMITGEKKLVSFLLFIHY